VAYAPTLEVLACNTVIYYPKQMSNCSHHRSETWHHLTSSQFPSGLSAGQKFKWCGYACASETKV